MNLAYVLLSPVVTEKSTAYQAKRTYTFKVHSRANKVEIAAAVHQLYGVDVQSVRVIPIPQKVRMVGRGFSMAKRPAVKKALITIAPKQTIDFNKFSKK